ncbi:CBN-CUP-4 protein [Caenorhabditis brenneri]|uniref:Acetylcholine receptor-like protein cup-4 n=1 Tax=Caenorhabditis brenneri TaxID=135651 RepID=G0MGF3_CAEBE|nr:CBN-CUP-4 protein [Caenorhabditis brenneri]
MRLLIFLCFIFVFYLPILNKKADAQSFGGIDSEDGEAEMFYNKTYSQHQTTLEETIFRGYSPKIRPVKNGSVPTVVDVHWHIIHISINQVEQTMTVHGHIYMRWFDEFLVWDPKDFNGIHYARVKKWQVWQPKIKVSNSASGLGSAFDFSTSAHVIIQMMEKDRAKIEMYPTFSIKVGCAFDFADYPYDENKCSLNLFSTSTMAEVQLQNLFSIPPTLSFGWEEQRMKRIISHFKINNVSCSSFYYSGGNISRTAPVTGFDLSSTWSMLAVDVKFERHAPLYIAAIIFPCVLSAVLCQTSFCLPKKLAPIVILVLLYIQVIFLQDLTKPLPLAVTNMPPCINLYMWLMVSNGVFGMITVVLLGLTFTKLPVPKIFTTIYVLHEYLPEVLQGEGRDKKKVFDVDHPTSWDEFNTIFRDILGIFIFFYYITCFIFFVILGL